MELLSDWITGFIGNENSQSEAASIVQVVIAGTINTFFKIFFLLFFYCLSCMFIGNSIRGSAETFTRKGYFENKKKEFFYAREVHRAVHLLDLFVSKISKSCPVTLLPGEFDPSCHSIPQHPIHPQILPLTLK